MAVDNEHRLLSKIIRDRNLIPVLERGIKESWVVDDDVRRVWKFVTDHYIAYSEVPTAITVKDNFPNFKVYDVQDTIEYLIDQMVEFRRRTLTRSGVESVVEQLANNDHNGALAEMEKTVAIVNDQGIKGTTHVDLTTNPDQRLLNYQNVLNSVLLGIPTGFAKIDQATAGLQGGQLITLIAPPKTGKSQIALKVAINTHAKGFVPMFQSFEMNNNEQSLRHDAMRANISTARLRQGTLDPDELTRYQDLLTTMKSEHPFHLVDAVNGLTVDALLAKAEQLKPSILFVDGVYLMIDQVTGESNSPQALTNITRSLKRMAQRLNIPVIITTQTLLWKMRGGKVTADSIGYSSSFFQDSDVILGLEPIEGNDQVRLLKIVQSRNCGPEETSITWLWDQGCFHDEADAATCKYCTPYAKTTP
jgi:DnaB-like helicase C terminal domain